MNHWMQNQQFLTKPQLWNGTEESEGHAGTKRQMDCSKQMVNRQRNLRKSDWMWRKKDKKLRDTQRETEITSAAQQESWWERARNFLVHARTTHTVCLSVCVTVSLYVCLCGHTGIHVCVCVYGDWAAAAGATAGSAISGEMRGWEEKWRRYGKRKRRRGIDLKESMSRYLSLGKKTSTTRKRSTTFWEDRKRGWEWNKKAVVEESFLVLLDKDKTTDCDVKVQTVSSTAGTCCFSIRVSPRN